MLPVAYTPIAEKYFKKLKDKQLKNTFKKAIVNIRVNPEIGDAKTTFLPCVFGTLYIALNTRYIKLFMHLHCFYFFNLIS
jgi:N-acetylglutamate synthase/N-acetylornithine aminotransferase